jgi:hypothetical protein
MKSLFKNYYFPTKLAHLSPVLYTTGAMLNAHTRKAINELILPGYLFLYFNRPNRNTNLSSPHYLSIAGAQQRPFMYWANKPNKDCIERLFKYYEHSKILSPFNSPAFLAKWATVVKGIANAEK